MAETGGPVGGAVSGESLTFPVLGTATPSRLGQLAASAVGEYRAPSRAAASSSSGGDALFARAQREIPDLLRQMGVSDLDEDKHREEVMKLARFALNGMKSMSGVAEVLAALIMGAESGGGSPSMQDVMGHLALTRSVTADD